MKRFLLIAGLGAAVAAAGVASQGRSSGESGSPWRMNATVIEACSCPMFCQCYFNPEPAAHEGHHGEDEHFCRFNMAFKVNSGRFGNLKLDGAKFWVAGDLGTGWEDGRMDWSVVTFDKSLAPDTRKAIATILASLFPVEWDSRTTAEGAISWEATPQRARATLDGGQSGEIVLKHPGAPAANASNPVVIQNLQYWGATSNDGFVLMPNEVQAYRVGPKAFEFRGTNGFMITVDIDSKSAATKTAAKS